jgi:hypothetical protein
MTVAVWKPTREEVQILNQYHRALLIYYHAVSNWLSTCDFQGKAEERQRLTDEKNKAEQTCRTLRADLDKLRAPVNIQRHELERNEPTPT